MCLREIRKTLSMSEFYGRKTVKPHLSRISRPIGVSIFPFETTISLLTTEYRCNNRAENELFNKNYTKNQLNNNKYSVIERERKF